MPRMLNRIHRRVFVERLALTAARRVASLVVLLAALFGGVCSARAADARFDLVGPKIEVRVTRGSDTLPIASVPNLQAGDRLWLHPDLPTSQSVKYLLICVFLRGTTNPPPENWFYRIETWNRKIQQEGAFITVPPEAEQVVLLLAPETGGDFATLKSAVRGRPGVFVRAAQDLNEAGFEQARIDSYLAAMRRVPPSDTANLQKHSDLLARTLNLKPNPECFKRPIDQQFSCLTQSGSQLLMDDGHGQSVVTALSNGPTSDFISQASYTQLAGAGTYSAYVGAVVDLVRIMASLHVAQYQYIPAIASPQGEALNLHLNTPPSFHNPKSVLVVGLPSVQPATKPPLQPADPNHIACLLQPSVVLPIDGAPLVFSTEFATEMVLHLNTPPGAPLEADIPLVADAYDGGLRLQPTPEHHVQITDVRQPLGLVPTTPSDTATSPSGIAPASPASRKKPVELPGTVQGRWGFDPFTGPTLTLQQLPGSDWHLIGPNGNTTDVIAGKTAELLIASTGSACVHTITAQNSSGGTADPLSLAFRPAVDADHAHRLAVSLPANAAAVDIQPAALQSAAPQAPLLPGTPGNLHIEIQQYGQAKPDSLQARTFADPPHIVSVALAAGDRSLLLTGSELSGITRLTLGDLLFQPDPAAETPSADETSTSSLRLSLPPDAPAPPTHAGEHLNARLTLNDGRELPIALTVAPNRPSISLLNRSFEPVAGSLINLSNPQDLPLSAHLEFTLKSQKDFSRTGRVEVQTLDGALHTVLTLAPAGGLVLQDPRTVVASLDPLAAFGPSAFGALQVRAIFPSTHKSKHADTPVSAPGEGQTGAIAGQADLPLVPDPLTVSDWLPLGMLVRLPTLTHLQCAPDPNSPCNLTGSNLYLMQAVSADPAFAHPDPVPDGFTGNTIAVPHPAGSAGTLFLKLRDDPDPIDTATLPFTPGPTQASTAHGRASTPNPR